MEDGTNRCEDNARHERRQATSCGHKVTSTASPISSQAIEPTNYGKSKQEVGGRHMEAATAAAVATVTGNDESKMIESAPEPRIVKSLLVELHKFGKWQRKSPAANNVKSSDTTATATTTSTSTTAMAAASKTVRLIEVRAGGGGSHSLRQINIVGQLNHSAFRGMLTACMSMIVILLGALLARQPHSGAEAAIWKSIFASGPSSSLAHNSGESGTPTSSSALKLPFVSHLMTSSATNPLASFGQSIWPIATALKSSGSSTSGQLESNGKPRAARHSDPVEHQRGVALGHEPAAAAAAPATPVSQQYHYFWNHDHIDQKTMSDEAQKILADAQQQTDQIAARSASPSLDRRDTNITPAQVGGNLSSITTSDQMATSASGDSDGAQVAIPPLIQQQLTSMVLHLQRQAQMSNMNQPRFGAGALAAAVVAPAAAQRRFETAAVPSPTALLNPMARFWTAPSSQHPVLALPPSSSGPSFATPLFGQHGGPSAATPFPVGFGGGAPLDSAALASQHQVSQQLMQPRASLAGVPIYGPFMVAPSMTLAPPSHSLHALALPSGASPNRNQQTGSHKRSSPSVSRQPSASGRLASTLFGRHRKGGWFGSGASSTTNGGGVAGQQQVAAASGPRPTIALPPAGALAAETARSLAASLPPESLALIEAASSQLASIIMNQMHARSAQQQQQHKMAITAATAAALAARVQQQQQQQQVDPQQSSQAADQMQSAGSAPVGQQQQQQQQQQVVDNQQLFELGSATVNGLNSLQPPYLLNAAQSLLAGPRGSAIANSLLGQYNQAMSMMRPAQVLELAKLGLPVQLGAFSSLPQPADGGGEPQFGSHLRRRQVVAATPGHRSLGQATMGRAHQAAAPYASPVASARPAASFDEQPLGAAQVTFDREIGGDAQNTEFTSTTPGGATENISFTDSGDSPQSGGGGGGGGGGVEQMRSTLAPSARTTAPVVVPGSEQAGVARKARQLQPQVPARSIKPRNVLMPREPIDMRQLFMVEPTAKHHTGAKPLVGPARTGRSLLAPAGKKPLANHKGNLHLVAAASELFETVPHDDRGQNQLRRLKRSTTGWKSVDRTKPPAKSRQFNRTVDLASLASWQLHDAHIFKRVEPTTGPIMLKRQAELASAGNATAAGDTHPAMAPVTQTSSTGETTSTTSKRQDRAYKVKRITASASVMHHNHQQAAHHPIAKLAASSGASSAQRTKSTSQFVPIQTVVGVKATPPPQSALPSSSSSSSTSQTKSASVAATPQNVAHVKQHSSTGSSGAKQQVAPVDPLGVDPMAASLAESARVVNYFANVENDTPPPPQTTTTSSTRAPQPVHQVAAAAATSMHSSPPAPPGQPQINVGFAAPKIQRAPAPLALDTGAGRAQGHAHSGNSGNSGNSGIGSAGSVHGLVASPPSLPTPASFQLAPSTSFHASTGKQQRPQQQAHLRSLPVPAGSADISSAATGNHAYTVQQGGGVGGVANQGAGNQQQQQHFGSQSGNQMLAGQQQPAQQAGFSARQFQLPQLTTAASVHNKQTLMDTALVNRNNLISTLLSMSPKSSASQQQQQQQPVSQQSQQVAIKQHNLNSMDRSPMADQSGQYHDEILAPSQSGQQQQQSQANMGGPPLGLYGAQMLGEGGDAQSSSAGSEQTLGGNNQQQQQYQAYMEMNGINSGGQSVAGDNRVESMIQQQANEQQNSAAQQQGQMLNGGAHDFGVRNQAAGAASSQQQQQQQQQQSSDPNLNLSEQPQMELSRFNNQRQQQVTRELTSQQVAQLNQQQQQLLSSGQSASSIGDPSSQDQFISNISGPSVQDALLDGTNGSPTATETANQLLGGSSGANNGEPKWPTGSDQQQQQLLEAQSQSLVGDAAGSTGGGAASDSSSAQLQNSNWPAALQAALANSQQSTRLNMQLEDAMAVRNALLQSQIQQYNQQSQQSSSSQPAGVTLDRNFFQSSGSGSQASSTDQQNQLLLAAAQNGIDEEAAANAAAAAGIPSYPSAAQLLAIQAHGHQMSPLATAGALQLTRSQDFMSNAALSMAGSEKRESGGGSGSSKRTKKGGTGGASKKGDLKHISHHYHFNSLGSPLEDPDSPLLTTSQLDFAGQIAANEQVKADKLARQKRKQKEQQQQQQQEEQAQQQQQQQEEEQRPKKKGFLRRFSLKNFFKRFRKDKQKEHAQHDQQSPSEDSQGSDGGGGGGSEQQSSGGGESSSGSSDRAAAARAA